MTSNEMIRQPQTSGELADMKQLGTMMGQMVELMRGVAESQRILNERVEMLEKQNALATRVTAAQTCEISKAIQRRAEELCTEYGLDRVEERHVSVYCHKIREPIARAIRKAVKLAAGVNSLRELPRCEYSVTLEQIALWEDYRAITTVKERFSNAYPSEV